MSTTALFHVPAYADRGFATALAGRIGAKDVTHTRPVFPSSEMVVEVPHDMFDHAVIVWSPAPPRSESLIELIMLADALVRGGVQSITCVLRYVPYSRSNRVNRRGLPLGARVVISMLEGAPIDRFVVFDLHARDTLGFFSRPVVSFSSLGLLSAAIPSSEKETVVSPDRGRYDECVDLAELRGCAFDMLVKVRRDHSGDSVLVAGARTNVRGRSVLLYDDEIWTGQTAEHAIQTFHDAGVASVHYLTVYDFSTDEIRLRMLDTLGVASFTTTNLALPASPDLHANYNVLDASELAAARLLHGGANTPPRRW